MRYFRLVPQAIARHPLAHPLLSLPLPFPLSRSLHSFKSTNMSPSPPIKVLILETDHPHPEIHDSKGSYAEILQAHLTKAGKNHDPPLDVEVDMHFVVDDPDNGKDGHVPKATEVDEGVQGVLITGSMYDAHGDEKWIQDLMGLLKELWTTRPKLHFSGVCFGHQLLCRLLGSTVEPVPSEEWELGHSKIDLSDIGVKLFRTSKPHIHLHQMHQDHVVSPPSSSHPLLNGEEVHVWGSSDHTAVQGIYVRNRLLTMQAHLAFDEEMVNREIEMRVEKGAIEHKGDDKEEVDRAKETAGLRHDGEVVAAALLRYWAYDDDGIE